MEHVTVYSSTGELVESESTTGELSSVVEQWALDGTRLVADPPNDLFGMYFRAKKTSKSRSEQYYGLLTPDEKSAPLSNTIQAIRQWCSEYGYTLETDHNSMSVFNTIDTGDVDGDIQTSDYTTVATEIAASNSEGVVKVPDARTAFSLLVGVGPQYTIRIIPDIETSNGSVDLTICITNSTANTTEPVTPTPKTAGLWDEIIERDDSLTIPTFSSTEAGSSKTSLRSKLPF